MLAKDVRYEWDTFKHEFKRRKGYYGISFMNQGVQVFHFNQTGGKDALEINPKSHDQKALDITLMSREFHFRFASGAVGYPISKYCWLEYAIRTGRFTYHFEQNSKMKQYILALLHRFNISVVKVNTGGGWLICHPALFCNPCNGSGIHTVPLSKTDVKRSIDSTCEYCDGFGMNSDIDITTLSGWTNFAVKE